MTKLREPGTLHDALWQTIAIVGGAQAAIATGKTAGYLERCSNPDEGRDVSLRDAVALSALVIKRDPAETPPLLRFFKAAVDSARLGPAGVPAMPPLPEALLDVNAALGTLAGRVRDALADETLCEAERKRLLADALRVSGAALKIVETLRRPAPGAAP